MNRKTKKFQKFEKFCWTVPSRKPCYLATFRQAESGLLKEMQNALKQNPVHRVGLTTKSVVEALMKNPRFVHETNSAIQSYYKTIEGKMYCQLTAGREESNQPNWFTHIFPKDVRRTDSETNRTRRAYDIMLNTIGGYWFKEEKRKTASCYLISRNDTDGISIAYYQNMAILHFGFLGFATLIFFSELSRHKFVRNLSIVKHVTQICSDTYDVEC